MGGYERYRTLLKNTETMFKNSEKYSPLQNYLEYGFYTALYQEQNTTITGTIKGKMLAGVFRYWGILAFEVVDDFWQMVPRSQEETEHSYG